MLFSCRLEGLGKRTPRRNIAEMLPMQAVQPQFGFRCTRPVVGHLIILFAAQFIGLITGCEIRAIWLEGSSVRGDLAPDSVTDEGIRFYLPRRLRCYVPAMANKSRFCSK